MPARTRRQVATTEETATTTEETANTTEDTAAPPLDDDNSESGASDADDERSEIELAPLSSPPPPPLSSPLCTANRLCRIRNALFQGLQSGEMVPLPQLLYDLRPDDVRTAPPAELETIRQSIGAAFLGKSDPKWMQFYILTLMRDVDVMEEAVLDMDLSEAHEIIRRVALGVMQSKSVAGPALRNPNGIVLPLWAVVTVGVVVLLFVVLMVVFFAVLLRDLLRFKTVTQTTVTI